MNCKLKFFPSQEGESGILIESMDACFGLVRKKSAAKSILPPRHMTMFANQTDVDEFVDNYTSNAKRAETVSIQYTYKSMYM